MVKQPVHREDIKAVLRKRYRSLREFEIARGIKARSVTDVLRGKPSRPTADAIAEELSVSVHELFPNRFESVIADCSDVSSSAHRLNRGGK